MTRNRVSTQQRRHLAPSHLSTLFLTILLSCHYIQLTISKENNNNEKPRIITEFELSEFDGVAPDSTIWLSILGSVYDVTAGRNFYGNGAGYGYFSGKDASPCFISGDFNPEGLIKDLESFEDKELRGITDWRKFYEESDKYFFVGLLEGLYYDEDGRPTEKLKRIHARLGIEQEL